MEAFLLGQIDFARCLELQQRLVRHVAGRDDGQIVLLLCEHPPTVTVGRNGTPGQVLAASGLLRSGEIPVQWVNRGGGCLMHAPGQLAVYCVVPLAWHRASVGEYLRRLGAGIVTALGDVGVRARMAEDAPGVWGRTGRLGDVGISVRNWVSYHGAFINVCPAMGLFRLVEPEPGPRPGASCLVAECGRPVRMTSVRAALINRLAEALGCDRYHMYTGHPWLAGRG